MARLVVADLLDAVVCCLREAGVVEEAGVEELDALLVKGVDGPFGGEEVLEEQVVRVAGAVGDGEDGAGRVAGEGRGFATVGAVRGAFSGYGSIGWVIDWGDGERLCVCWVSLCERAGDCYRKESVREGQHVGGLELGRWTSRQKRI